MRNRLGRIQGNSCTKFSCFLKSGREKTALPEPKESRLSYQAKAVAVDARHFFSVVKPGMTSCFWTDQATTETKGLPVKTPANWRRRFVLTIRYPISRPPTRYHQLEHQERTDVFLLQFSHEALAETHYFPARLFSFRIEVRSTLPPPIEASQDVFEFVPETKRISRSLG